MQSDIPVKYSPFSGERILTFDKPYLWRGDADVWYFNPWTGEKRHLNDVNCDKHGYMIIPPGEEVNSSSDGSGTTSPPDPHS